MFKFKFSGLDLGEDTEQQQRDAQAYTDASHHPGADSFSTDADAGDAQPHTWTEMSLHELVCSPPP